MAIIKTCLELYDFSLISELKKKFVSVLNTKWVFAPPDLHFRNAKEELGRDIFPMFGIWRPDPPLRFSQITDVSNYRNELPLSDEFVMEYINKLLTYQIDFYSTSMYDMNQMIMDTFKWEREPYLEFDFTELNLNLTEPFKLLITLEEPTSNDDAVREMYEKGRYFRYTIIFHMLALLFEVKEAFVLETIEFQTIYDNTIHTLEVN
ncbi:MAG: hypothetical protein ACM31H_05565 [Nitrososphaerales archaeon]